MQGEDKCQDAGSGEEVRFRSTLDARGFTMLWNVVLLDRQISDGALRTYLTLCFHARQDVKCWPGQKVLALERGCTLRSIQMHLGELERRGLIAIERRGKTLSNLYWIEDVRDAYAPPALPDTSSDLSSRCNPVAAPESEAKIFSPHSASDTKISSPHPTREAKNIAHPKKKNQPSEKESINNNNKPSPAPAAVAPCLSVVASDLIEKLTGMGVTHSVAESLAREYPAERVERQIAQLPHRRADEPGAVLVKAIREDWAAPAGWQHAQAERRKREREVHKEREQQTAQDAARAQEEAQAARAAALWDSLTNAERAALTDRAEEAARARPHLAALLAKRPDSPLVQAVVSKRRAELLAEMLAACTNGSNGNYTEGRDERSNA